MSTNHTQKYERPTRLQLSNTLLTLGEKCSKISVAVNLKVKLFKLINCVGDHQLKLKVVGCFLKPNNWWNDTSGLHLPIEMYSPTFLAVSDRLTFQDDKQNLSAAL